MAIYYKKKKKTFNLSINIYVLKNLDFYMKYKQTEFKTRSEVCSYAIQLFIKKLYENFVDTELMKALAERDKGYTRNICIYVNSQDLRSSGKHSAYIKYQFGAGKICKSEFIRMCVKYLLYENGLYHPFTDEKYFVNEENEDQFDDLTLDKENEDDSTLFKEIVDEKDFEELIEDEDVIEEKEVIDEDDLYIDEDDYTYNEY